MTRVAKRAGDGTIRLALAELSAELRASDEDLQATKRLLDNVGGGTLSQPEREYVERMHRNVEETLEKVRAILGVNEFYRGGGQ